MIRVATEADIPDLLAYLEQRPDSTMFLRGNLLDHGIGPGPHPHSTRYWIASEATGIVAVVGVTGDGYMLVNARRLIPDWAECLRSALAGVSIKGLNGEAGSVTQLRSALGLDAVAPSFEDREPHFALDLDDLVVPDGRGVLRPPTEADLDRVTDWRIAFDREIFGDADRPAAVAASTARARRLIDGGDARLLVVDGAPVAMTAFNARVPGMVQIGSVYTPPAHRGQGYARRIVALHLAEARAAGDRRAILFSAAPAATRAYQAIGFRQIGHYILIDFSPPQIIGEAS